jgi:Zn-dependent alcohol dehydrogenase
METAIEVLGTAGTTSLLAVTDNIVELDTTTNLILGSKNILGSLMGIPYPKLLFLK